MLGILKQTHDSVTAAFSCGLGPVLPSKDYPVTWQVPHPFKHLETDTLSVDQLWTLKWTLVPEPDFLAKVTEGVTICLGTRQDPCPLEPLE